MILQRLEKNFYERKGNFRFPKAPTKTFKLKKKKKNKGTVRSFSNAGKQSNGKTTKAHNCSLWDKRQLIYARVTQAKENRKQKRKENDKEPGVAN